MKDPVSEGLFFARCWPASLRSVTGELRLS